MVIAVGVVDRAVVDARLGIRVRARRLSINPNRPGRGCAVAPVDRGPAGCRGLDRSDHLGELLSLDRLELLVGPDVAAGALRPAHVALVGPRAA